MLSWFSSLLCRLTLLMSNRNVNESISIFLSLQIFFVSSCCYQPPIFTLAINNINVLIQDITKPFCQISIVKSPFGGCSGISILEKTLSLKMSSQVQSLQKQLTQLRQEAGVNRIPVSEAIQDILSYTNQHAQDDALVIGVNQSENPFREPKPCSIL